MKIKKIGKAPTPAYSFVVPIYNDGGLAPAFCSEFQGVFCKILGRRKIRDKIELIFVNDGSLDNSSEALNHLARTVPFVRVVHLSRNFGQHLALTCGGRLPKAGRWDDECGSLGTSISNPASDSKNENCEVEHRFLLKAVNRYLPKSSQPFSAIDFGGEREGGCVTWHTIGLRGSSLLHWQILPWWR